MTDTDAPASSRRGKMTPKKPGSEPRPGRVRNGLAIIFATLALIAGGYLWYTVLYENADLFTTDIVGALDRIESGSVELQEAQATISQELKTLKETQDTMRAAIEKLNADLSRNRLEWALTETEQLLIIANNRLQLARDTHSALAALHAADRQLQQLASPKLLPVRRELAREIAQLEALEKTDISGITLRLVTLADSVDRLPLALDIRLRDYGENQTPTKETTTSVTAAQTGWRGTARNLWQDILSLVRIRHDVESQRPLLPPEQQYFLRENLRLMLFGAQQALLQGNIATYQQNLKSAQRLMKDYFDIKSPAIAAMQNDLGELQSMKIFTTLPDISDSLTTLRRLSGRRAEP